MISLEARAEQTRLARALGVQPDELEFLMEAPEEDLRALRERVSDELFEADRRQFEKMIRLAKRLPAPVNATLAHRALKPRLAARVAALLPPEMITDIVKRLPPHVLAEIAAYADARRLAQLLDKVPPRDIGDIARELQAQEDWVVMGAFVSHLRKPQLEAAIAQLDSEALLRTGFVVEDKPKVIDTTVRMLSDERLVAYVKAAVNLELVPEALELARHLTRRQVKRMSQSLASLSDEELENWIERIRSEPILEEAAAELLEVAPLRVRSAAGMPDSDADADA